MCGSLEGKAYARALRAKPGTQSVLLPVGSGIEVSRYLPARLSADAKKSGLAGRSVRVLWRRLKIGRCQPDHFIA
ncbi:hypothetical protein BTL50_12440 [Bordetella holmesii]|nr:hypothetical protein BTL46_12390 [Bordetella holmesii]AUL23502.1 hypothetical protein BTL48_12380 [Bordetella holmesii]AUL26827.1 hypothetical protein BTL49_12455 [Bordetella holmesii]AUL30172.1 hypothetical protein BTL50_12440 [Bordetella holmesii]AUL33497.1 hypothetical protein BTL51_12440 [Bordetella holmesii]